MRTLKVLNMQSWKVLAMLVALSAPAFAQSANTATIVVLVADQQAAMVSDAKVTVNNDQTGAIREAMSGSDGRATFGALSLTGTYTVTVSKQGFGNEERKGFTLRAGETATLMVRLLVGSEKTEVTVYGTTEGVRADAQIGHRIDSQEIDETPILGRKLTTLPLFNSAFRQGKGTGDLFVNETYFITGGGSRRTTTFMLDGASNDEAWGRQTMLATVPVGAVQEVAVLSNAFSAEFGWTAGPAMNIVTKSGTNAVHGEGLYLGRPGGWQAKTFSTDGFCPPSVSTCTTPTTLTAINPGGRPGCTEPGLRLDWRPVRQGQDVLLHQRRLHPAGPDDVPLEHAAVLRAAAGRQPDLRRALPSDARQRPARSQAYAVAVIDGARQRRSDVYDTNPNDAVVGTSAPTVARRYTRKSWTTQVNHTAVLELQPAERGAVRVPARRSRSRSGSPRRSRRRTRAAGSVPFTIGESRSSDLFGHQVQFADTVSWSRGLHNLRFGGSVTHHTTRRHGQRARQAVLGTFTFISTTTAPFDQLTLADVQQYSQPISYGDHELRVETVDVGGVRAGQLPRQQRPHARPRAALRPPDPDGRDGELRAASRLWLASRTAIPGWPFAAATGCTTRRFAPTRSPAP